MVGIKRVKAHLSKRAQKLNKGKGRYDEIDIDDDRDRVMLRWVPVMFRAQKPPFKCYMQKLEHKNFVTYLCQVLDCLRKGLTKEKQLASQALGLLAITLSETENSEEIFRYTISLITTLLRVPNKAPKNQLVNANTLSTLIYAWMFLLTKVERWDITYRLWQGAISQFITLLKEDATCVAAGEALALIFDCGNIDKFFGKTEELLFESYNELRNHIKYIVLEAT
ncbi:hypothetical protein PIB30_072110 [Stylosanthes scabra]|uniref:Interferon-related developmental regulator N-terminal domain-containing protein n=1 Tax=Stylosanthes scabra TaxID=79078 RepID=A0ABU6RP44_9FABA|nr:hypothetical protein [Stylosanthes scabra]